jgi:hypothetical protein
VEVVGQENVTIDGQSISAFKIIDRNAIESSTVYAGPDGDLLRIDNSVAGLPMQIRKERKEMALAPAGSDTMPDLIALTSNRPTGASLDGARSAKSITYHLGGITRPLPTSDSVESIDYVPTAPGTPTSAARTADVTIHARPLPEKSASAPLFPDATKAPTNLQPFLVPSVYVDSADPRFHTIAHSVLGDGPNDCVSAAEKISAYVHRTVKPDPSIAALRSATDVCNDPRGVCRDYTSFFAAIARAAGLPTKQCFGVAYDGRAFVGHAWPEVWVGKTAEGKDRWVAIEPTWGRPFADATHLKLAEGELTDFFTVAGDLTKYKIDVVKVE